MNAWLSEMQAHRANIYYMSWEDISAMREH